MSKHTPGPWETDDGIYVTSIEGVTICDVHGGHSFATITTETRKANAAFIVEACNNYDRLTATVKELADALEKVLPLIEGYSDEEHIRAEQIIAAALKRAGR